MPALRTRDTSLSRPLEVAEPPALAIVSPTPRTFTFPATHNLADSPYSSPASSPFEPDARSRTLLATNTPPPYLRPDSPLRPSSPASPASHKRRKSSCSSDPVERRPKKGDEDYIKRPENAFILFRRKCCEDRQAEEEAAKADGAKKPRQADLSKTISQMWKGLPAEERQKWEQMAKDKKKEHEQMYPNYVYRPQRAKDKDGKPKANKKSTSTTTALKKLDESESLSFVVPVSRPHGRSASLPTPPPYQSIQMPNVYHLTPSCPTSPSLLPMISRRSAHPGHPEDIFDYLPTNTYAPSSFPMPTQFETSLQNIFTTNDITFKNTEQTLQHLTIGSPQDNLLLPSHQIVSPASSITSGSSGPSSPSSGPYTPSSLLPPPTHHHHNEFLMSMMPMPSTGDPALDAQAQANIDLHLEMQLEQEFASFTWDGWPSTEPSIIQENDFDINAIPPIELGVPKYEAVYDRTIATTTATSTTTVDYTHPHANFEDGLGFGELMAGHGF